MRLSGPLLHEMADAMQQAVSAGEMCGTGCCVEESAGETTLLEVDDHITDSRDPCLIHTCTVRE